MSKYIEKARKDYKEYERGYNHQIQLIADAEEEGRDITFEDISELKTLLRRKTMFYNKMIALEDVFGVSELKYGETT